jgi:IS5 family transposase
MMGKVDAQGSMVQMVSLEQLVPQRHFLRKLDAVLDLGFVPGFLQQAYPSNVGHPGVDPMLAVRMILLSYLYDLSDGRVCEEVHFHAGYRWFCRLDFHRPVPDRTTLVKFRGRCRKYGLWEELFHRIVAECRDVGLLSGRHLMADSTQVQACASIKSLREIESGLTEAADRLCAEEEKPAAKPNKDDDHHHTDFHGKRFSNKTHRSTSDPDAQFYRKSKGKEAKLSYKAHNLADTKSRVIVATSATRVSGEDACDGAQALALLKQASERHGINPNTLCADSMYGNAETIAALYTAGIGPHIPLLCKKPPEIPSWKRRTFDLERLRKRKEKWTQAMALHHAAELSTRKGYNISRKLRHRIEHLFGEAKESHGLARARYRGLANMNEQVTLTAIAQNLKRLVKFLNQPLKSAPNKAAGCPQRPFHSLFSGYHALLRLESRCFHRLAHSLSIHHRNPALQMP